MKANRTLAVLEKVALQKLQDARRDLVEATIALQGDTPCVGDVISDLRCAIFALGERQGILDAVALLKHGER